MMLVDFALISGLLIVAQILRAKIPGAARFLVPSAMIAGFIGLVAGPEVLDLLPFAQVATPAGGSQLQLSRYPGVLITLVFATLLLGHRGPINRSMFWRDGVRSTLFFNLGAEIGQYGVAILFVVCCLQFVYPLLPEDFALMMPAGFAGGHGTATIFGQAFASQGWQDALSVGFAFATLGLIASLAGGMLFINIAVRRGWTQLVGSDARVPHKERQSFLSEADRFPLGMATANPMAIDPLLWHVALLGAVYGLTIGFDVALHAAFPGEYWIPQFAVAMLIGALLQRILDWIGIGRYVDATAMRRLGSLCADLLVVCGVASIQLSVVWQYAGPIALLSAVGFVYSIFFLLLGYWVFREYWFERSIFTYGWLTGVVGFSVALLRVVDPRLKSETVENYGAAYLVIGPAEMVVYPAIIWACAFNAHAVLGTILVVLAAILVFAARGAAIPFFRTREIQRRCEADALKRQTI